MRYAPLILFTSAFFVSLTLNFHFYKENKRFRSIITLQNESQQKLQVEYGTLRQFVNETQAQAGDSGVSVLRDTPPDSTVPTRKPEYVSINVTVINGPYAGDYVNFYGKCGDTSGNTRFETIPSGSDHTVESCEGNKELILTFALSQAEGSGLRIQQDYAFNRGSGACQVRESNIITVNFKRSHKPCFLEFAYTGSVIQAKEYKNSEPPEGYYLAIKRGACSPQRQEQLHIFTDSKSVELNFCFTAGGLPRERQFEAYISDFNGLEAPEDIQQKFVARFGKTHSENCDNSKPQHSHQKEGRSPPKVVCYFGIFPRTNK